MRKRHSVRDHLLLPSRWTDATLWNRLRKWDSKETPLILLLLDLCWAAWLCRGLQVLPSSACVLTRPEVQRHAHYKLSGNYKLFAIVKWECWWLSNSVYFAWFSFYCDIYMGPLPWPVQLTWPRHTRITGSTLKWFNLAPGLKRQAVDPGCCCVNNPGNSWRLSDGKRKLWFPAVLLMGLIWGAAPSQFSYFLLE